MKHTRPLVLGVIGGAGTGKTHFAKYAVKHYDALFIEGDVIGHKALTEPFIIEAIQKAFGSHVIVDGQVDRKALGQEVFGKREQLNALNAIMHPFMFKMIEEMINECDAPVVVFEAAVMIEAGFMPLVDVMFAIVADEHIRVERLTNKRQIDEGRAKNMISSGRQDYCDYGDYIIDTTLDIERIEDDIDRILDKIALEAKKKHGQEA